MKVPVVPFLPSLALLEGAVCASFAYRGCWPLGVLAAANFTYSTHREIWHNGRPLVVWRRK